MAEEQTSGEREPDPDFTAGPFVTCRDPVHQLIKTISGLYLNPEDKGKEEQNPEAHPLWEEPLPPPPPVEEDEDSFISVMLADHLNQLEISVHGMEGEIMSQLGLVLQRMSILEQQLAEQKQHVQVQEAANQRYAGDVATTVKSKVEEQLHNLDVLARLYEMARCTTMSKNGTP